MVAQRSLTRGRGAALLFLALLAFDAWAPLDGRTFNAGVRVAF